MVIPMTFSLLSVHRTHPDGKIDGAWMQDHIGTLESARKRADDTSALNSNMDIAVVPVVSFCGPGEVFHAVERL